MNCEHQETSFKNQVSKYLNISGLVIDNIRQKNWGLVVGYFKKRWNEDGYRALKQNQNAVERIIKYFQGFKKCPNMEVDFETRKTIALYIERLGVGALLDDIKAALAANPKIKTLNYFIISQKGKKTPRWGMLYFDKLNQDWETRKMSELAAPDLGCVIGKKIEPEWVLEARQRLIELEAQKNYSQEYQTLKLRIAKYERNRKAIQVS